MAKEPERGEDETRTTKPKEHDEKLTDLTADKNKDVKGGGGTKPPGGGEGSR